MGKLTRGSHVMAPYVTWQMLLLRNSMNHVRKMMLQRGKESSAVLKRGVKLHEGCVCYMSIGSSTDPK